MRFAAVREAAEKHVGDTNIAGFVALVAAGEDVVFESAELPQAHREIQSAAYAALG